MNFRQWIPSATLAATLFLVSCSATQARINDNEELFSSYSPDVQAIIKSNRIDRGFDTTQVYLSFGNADRTESRDGQEIWYYHKTESQQVKEEKSAGEYRDDMTAYESAIRQGRNVKEPSMYRVYSLYRTRVERMVCFESNRVVSWDQPDEMWLDDWHR